MSFDGLIFDLDGTLWDCSSASAAAFNQTYEQFGVTKRVTEQFVRSISGKPSSECNEILLSGVADSLRPQVLARLDELEIASVQKYAPTALYAGVCDGIAALCLHYPLFVVSNCSEHYLDVFLRHTAIGPLFQDSECFGRTGRDKSCNIRELVDRNKLLAACYIGDTVGDEEAAQVAGVEFFHARYGFGVASRSHRAFRSFNELTEYFGAFT